MLLHATLIVALLLFAGRSPPIPLPIETTVAMVFEQPPAATQSSATSSAAAPPIPPVPQPEQTCSPALWLVFVVYAEHD